jgi:hypothetical protein
MKKEFKLTYKVKESVEIVNHVDQKILAHWAIDCVERVMPYFEEKFPDDKRPREAINSLKTWMETGEFHMKVIRNASLSSHRAAKEIGEDNPARSVAHAAGQAVATAHVPRHSVGAANYSLQAIYRASNPNDAWANVEKERDWQYKHLLDLRDSN